MSTYLFKNKLVGNVQERRKGKTLDYAKEPKRPLAECVLLETEENTFLKEFFMMVSKHAKRVRKAHVTKSEEGAEYLREIKDLDELVRNFASQRAELVARLRASGIEMTENVLGPRYTIGGYSIGNLDYREEQFNYAMSFNKLQLTKEILTNPDDTTYKDKFEEEKAENIKRAQRVKELKRELWRKRLFGGLNREEIQKIKSEIGSLEFRIKSEQYYERDYENYRRLSVGQKEGILKYLEATEAIEKGVRAIKLLQEKWRRAEEKVPAEVVLDEALDRMEADGMTQEDVERVFETIDDVAQKRRLGLYDKKGKVHLQYHEGLDTFVREAYGFDSEKEKTLEKDNYDIDAFER